MSPYIDCHTHVNFAAFDADREEVLQRAKDANVYVVNVGTQVDTSRKAIEIANQHEGVFAIVGLHPIHTEKSFHDEDEVGGKDVFTSRAEVVDDAVYADLLTEPKVVGLGECGLDYYHLSVESEKVQKEQFAAQIELAKTYNKPLMLHVRSSEDRNAYEDVYAMLREHEYNRGDVHFFAGSIEDARKFLDLGLYLSFTGVITFAKQYPELVEFVPLDRILSETDAPYVSPVPHRGKRNEPVFVIEVVKRIAEIKKLPEETVRDAIFANAQKLFGIN